jgi:acyl carrier protein
MNAAEVQAWIIGYIAEFLVIAPAEIRTDREFAALGLDSVDAVLIGGAFEERFDVEIDAAMFLRSRNIDELIAELRRFGLLA